MNRRRYSWVVMLFVAVALLAGCNRDPNVRKHKYFESGMRYSAEGKYREAVIQFSNALKVDKRFPDAHFELAQAYEHLGQYGPAYGELERTVELQPTNLKARIDLGNLLLANGNVDEAQVQANAVKAEAPNDPDLHAMLSAIALRRGQKEQALAEIRRAQQLDPSRASFHEDMAIIEAGDPASGSAVEEELKKAVALDPKSVGPKLLLGLFYARNNRLQDAEKIDWEAVATDPKSLAARTGVAQIILKEGDQSRAEQVLRQASMDLADTPQGVRLLADYYVSSGQLNKAKTEFASLAAKYPKNASVLKGYVRVLLQSGDYTTAQTEITGLMKTNGKDPEVEALNGIVLLNNGKASDAVNALQDAVKNNPKDAFVQYWLGRAALVTGDSSLAQKSFQQAVNLNPAALNAEEELARIAAQHGDMNLLEDVAGKTIVAAPRFAGGYVWRALTEISQGAADKAEADLKTAMTVAPQGAQAYVELGKLRFTQKKFPEGVVLEEEALQRDPNSVEAMRLLVSYDLLQKQPDKAQAQLNAQIAKCPRNSGFLDILAQLQIQEKHLDQAAAAAQKAMQIDSGDAEAVILVAQLQALRGQVANAISTWQQWSVAHPNDAGVYAILGTLEESRGNFPSAESDYKKSLAIQPSQPIAANNLAFRMLESGGNVDVALTLAQTARRGMPNSPSTADTLAWAYYYKGTYGFARDLLQDAIKDDPNNATMQYHLGMVYSKLQEKNNATIYLKKAISLAPGTPTAKDAAVALARLG